MTKLAPRAALAIGLLILATMFFLPVVDDHYMRENIVMTLALALPALVMLINLVAPATATVFHLRLGRVAAVMLILLMALLLFMYFERTGHRRVQLKPAYFLPAFALLMNGMAMARWKADAGDSSSPP